MARIVLTEDEAPLRAIFTRWLESAGHDVTPCQTATEGYAAIREHPETELLVTDLMMPGGNGADLVYLLNAVARTLPILVVTASRDDAELRELRAEAGVHSILRKPTTSTDFLAAVAKALATGKGGASPCGVPTVDGGDGKTAPDAENGESSLPE